MLATTIVKKIVHIYLHAQKDTKNWKKYIANYLWVARLWWFLKKICFFYAVTTMNLYNNSIAKKFIRAYKVEGEKIVF